MSTALGWGATTTSQRWQDPAHTAQVVVVVYQYYNVAGPVLKLTQDMWHTDFMQLLCEELIAIYAYTVSWYLRTAKMGESVL